MQIQHLPLVVEPNEGEASAFACMSISRDINVAYFSASLKNASQVLRSCSISQIVNLKRFKSSKNRPEPVPRQNARQSFFFLRRGKNKHLGRRKMCYFGLLTFNETIPSILGGGRAILYCGICFCLSWVVLLFINCFNKLSSSTIHEFLGL